MAFGGLVHQKSGTGQALAHALLGIMASLEVPVLSVFGLATDGANAMAGREGGARAHLQLRNPHMLWTHCPAHRVALACQALARLPAMARLDTLLSSLYCFFGNSPKQLECYFGMCDEVSTWAALAGGRWLGALAGERWLGAGQLQLPLDSLNTSSPHPHFAHRCRQSSCASWHCTACAGRGARAAWNACARSSCRSCWRWKG